MLSVYGKKTECTWYFSEIYCWNVSSNKARIYNLTLTTKSRDRREALYSERRAYGKFTGLCWLLSPKPRQLGYLPISTVEELIFSEEFLTLSTAAEQLEFIRRKLKVEREIVNQISSLTVGQRNNQALLAFGEERGFDYKRNNSGMHCHQCWEGYPFPY